MVTTPEELDPSIPESDGKEQERADERALFLRFKADPANARLEEELITKFLPLVYRIVHGYRHGPDQFDDIVQVGKTGLFLAIRRFDPEMNFRFSTYAWQTIRGEIQRYFRDKTWAVNVPRDLKEKSLKVFNAHNELLREMGHDPTVSELSKRTGFTEEVVQEAMELGSAYHPQSFMDNSRDSDYGTAVGDDTDSSEHVDMSATKHSIFWDSLLAQLPAQEAKVLRMYHFEDLTQKEIAERMATSQMNVSRIIRMAHGKLRRITIPEDFENLHNL
jgi:RNA polymerase sigma-B factor